MARPRKNNLEYFPHDVTMRNDKKIRAVRAKFGNEGYSIYCMMLEIIGEEDLLQFKIGSVVDWEILAGDLEIETERLRTMLEYFTTVDLLQLEKGFFRCRQLEKRGECVFLKRGRILDALRVSGTETMVTATETNEIPEKTVEPVTEMPQSKVKESKVKNKTYYPLSEKLKAHIINQGTDMVLKDSHLEKWSDSFRLMVEIDKRTIEQIENMMEYVFIDDFWAKNIRSAVKLRKQWNDGKLDRLSKKGKKVQVEPGNWEIKMNIKKKKIDEAVAGSYLNETECFKKFNDDCKTDYSFYSIPNHAIDSFCRFIKEYYSVEEN